MRQHLIYSTTAFYIRRFPAVPKTLNNMARQSTQTIPIDIPPWTGQFYMVLLTDEELQVVHSCWEGDSLLQG